MLRCTQCPDEFFLSKAERDSHFKTSGVWHPYCWDCDLYFDNDAELDEHTSRRHHLHHCFYCSLGFLSKEAVDKHTLAKHGKFICIPCDEGFETEVGMGRHYRISPRHPNCQKCGQGFKDKDILSRTKGHHRGLADASSEPEPIHIVVQRESLPIAPGEYEIEDSEDSASWHASCATEEKTESSLGDEEEEDYFDDASDYPNDTESDLEWTPALSEYESATEDDDWEEELDTKQMRLHTSSPAWAALFPLPETPEEDLGALSGSEESSIVSGLRPLGSRQAVLRNRADNRSVRDSYSSA
ncbi:hypothetical protein HWV62_39013 [Athelia sp. TMB]|nr:hypothetical protein HWV62_36282 [Athelia sp. TMB]KAF7980265.1 hypothetical protein HWV62_39013 [Athelia sp. TMB]